MSLNDQIRKNSYEATLTSNPSEIKEYELSVSGLDYAKTPSIRSQIPRGGVKKRLAEQEAARKKRGKLSLLQRRSLSGWLFALPFVLGIIFVYAPIIFTSLQVTFSDVATDGTMTFVGFKYYQRILSGQDPWFHITIWDGLEDLILQIPAIVIFALFMAIILNQKMTGRAVFRAIFFLPVILSTGIIDRLNSTDAFGDAISGSSGAIDTNTGEEAGGIVSALDIQQLLGGIKLGSGLVTYVTNLVNNIFDIVSRSGVQMLIFLSGLQSISPSIYESCQVEGASAWETFWKITLPMISPMILVNAVYTVIDLFTCYDNRVMQLMKQALNHGGEYGGSAGGPSVAGAMAWVYIGIVLLFILIVALILKSVVFYQRRD
ncbi:MAG: sugar ABC transporter permease [Clostridia bacterium]|nr:sugar ABC transporter permease [Clostridia bacterium]